MGWDQGTVLEDRDPCRWRWEKGIHVVDPRVSLKSKVSFKVQEVSFKVQEVLVQSPRSLVEVRSKFKSKKKDSKKHVERDEI